MSEERETTILYMAVSTVRMFILPSTNNSPYTTKMARRRRYTMLSTVLKCQDVQHTISAYIKCQDVHHTISVYIKLPGLLFWL